jgi:hypothetical protein
MPVLRAGILGRKLGRWSGHRQPTRRLGARHETVERIDLDSFPRDTGGERSAFIRLELHGIREAGSNDRRAAVDEPEVDGGSFAERLDDRARIAADNVG